MRHQSAVFAPVRSGNTFEETVERIAGAIKARLFNPGDQLPPERILAQQLGVSRSTLREALRVLMHAGYVEIRPGRGGGTFVTRWPDPPPGPERAQVLMQLRDILPDLLDYRRAVEPAAAELAALRGTPEEFQALEGILRGMSGSEDQFAQYRASDTRFHVGIAQAAKSSLILQAVFEVQTRLTGILDLIVYHSRRVLRHSTEYHWNILRAMQQRHPDQARRLMLDHILATESVIHGLVPEAEWPRNCVREASVAAPPVPADEP
jgi:Transcriptional regulators